MRDADTSLRLLPLWNTMSAVLIAAILYLSLTPNPVQVPMPEGDKLGHAVAYAALMFWFAQIHSALRRRVLGAAAFVAMGVVIEFLQRASGYRSFEVADMLADAIGIAAGWLLAPPRLPNLLRWVESHWVRARA